MTAAGSFWRDSKLMTSGISELRTKLGAYVDLLLLESATPPSDHLAKITDKPASVLFASLSLVPPRMSIRATISRRAIVNQRYGD